ncbi:MAG TPA: Xaa-Pro peptidase family protein [Solirubrobacteraceae bacterium]|nr:Xaa-Pro peptidase family protein [Solirubrobacteraceae bacterium]
MDHPLSPSATSDGDEVRARVPYAWTDREPLLELTFEIDEYRARLRRIQAAIGDAGLDGLLLYGGAASEANVRYVTGFPSWWGDSLAMVPATGDVTLITTAVFHGEPMHSNLQTTWVEDLRPLLNPQTTGSTVSLSGLAKDIVAEWGAQRGRLGLADTRIIPARVDSELRAALEPAAVEDATSLLIELRAVKSAAEIEVLRELGRIASTGMEAGLGAVQPGARESDIAAAVNHAAMAAGAERVPMGCFAIGGQRSFMKNVHARHDKRIERDELVSIDFAAVLGGYCSDMARVTVAGTASAELEDLMDTCLEAQEAGLAATAPGTPMKDVLAVMSDVVERRGWAEWDWTTSHGGGLELVEEPMFHRANARPLEAGMYFYIEPMIVPTHVGTICIEDLVLVTDDGCERLTTTERRTW